MDDLWPRLCRLLDDDPALGAAVSTAVADPAGFFAADAQRLQAFGVASGDDVDPWIVLIDGLDDAGALAYLAPGDAGEELADALAGLPRVVATGLDLDVVSDEDAGLDDAVAAADRLLAPHGLRILYIDEGTDDVPLVVVPARNAEEIVTLAARLGRTARVFPQA